MGIPRDIAAQTDGRRQRREDGRNRVIDAAISLVLDGLGEPTTEAVIERSGVSSASLFRYFENLDDLRSALLSRYFERIDPVIAIDNIGTGALPQRINTLCSTRIAFYESHAPMATLGRLRAQDVPEILSALQRLRATLNEQVFLQFEKELSQTRPPQRRYCQTMVSSMTSFESWSLLRADGLTNDQILRAWRFGITRLLNAA
jgi:AcrR family transcriptional regulator